MMRRPKATIVGYALALLIATATSRAVAKPPKAPKAPKPGHAARDLHKAYDKLIEVTALLRREPQPPQTSQLLARAKELYWSGDAANRGGDVFRAGELSKAAHDAARGLHHLIRATLPPPDDLSAPSSGPDALYGPGDEAYRELLRARDRISLTAWQTMPAAGREFLDAARQVYEQSRAAYSVGDFAKAAELGRAAEAWTHVGEHMLRAEGGLAMLGRGRRPPPPRDAFRTGREAPPLLD